MPNICVNHPQVLGWEFSYLKHKNTNNPLINGIFNVGLYCPPTWKSASQILLDAAGELTITLETVSKYPKEKDR